MIKLMSLSILPIRTVLLYFVLHLGLNFTGFTEAESNPSPATDEDIDVRVLLFGVDPPSSFNISTDSARVLLFRNGSSEEVILTEFSAEVVIRQNKIMVTTQEIQLHIDSLSVLALQSPARIITDSFGYRYYRGQIDIRPGPKKRTFSLINTIDLETYVASVVGSEMDFEEPEALKSQAVVSRTFALWSIQKSPYKKFDMYDYEASQMYVGEIRDKPRYKEAAEATTGEILTWSNQLILAVFSSTCGGNTANNRDVWGGDNHPYLRSQIDLQLCSASPHYRWEFELQRNELDEIIRDRYGFRFIDQEIHTDQSGRIQQMELIAPDGDRLRFTGNEFRLLINQHTNPLAVRSTKFHWVEKENTIVFSGRGLGHGVGLCQWGARGLAQNGWLYKDILTFYFSGVKIVNSSDAGQNSIILYK